MLNTFCSAAPGNRPEESSPVEAPARRLGDGPREGQPDTGEDRRIREAHVRSTSHRTGLRIGIHSRGVKCCSHAWREF